MKAGLVVDSSALLAVLLAEAERDRALDEIFGAETRLLSAFSYLETCIVVTSRKGVAGRALLDALLRDAALRVVDFDRDQTEIVHAAWTDFGRATTPPASTSATAAPTPWRSRADIPSCTRATTSAARTWRASS